MTSTLPPIVQAFSGAAGSAAANALTYPLDLVVTRLQLDSPERSKERGGVRGAKLILSQILEKHGWRALYDGLWPDTCATLLSNFFYFYFYSFLRTLSTKRLLSLNGPPPKGTTARPHKPTLLEELVLGFLAGVASRVVSTPLNIVTLRLQTEREDEESPNADSSQPMSVTEVVKLIYKEQGLAGFWRGFKTTTILSLNPSITLAFLQMFRRILSVGKSISPRQIRAEGFASALKCSKINVNQNLHPWEAFFGAAISNSIAISILYPLILAKTRLQVSSSTTMTGVLVDAYQGKHEGLTKLPVDLENQAEAVEKTSVGGGIEGLYQGLEMKIVKGFLSQGVTFLVKGRIEELIVAAYLRRRASMNG